MSRQLLWIIPAVVLVLIIIMVVVLRWQAAAAPQPRRVGLTDGQLSACRDNTQNCVRSGSSIPYAAMDPILFTGDVADAQARLKAIIDDLDRYELISEEPGYLHYISRSRAIGFPDDVEFQFDAENGLIQFRSASRMGVSDFSVNRQRMEMIAASFGGE